MIYSTRKEFLEHAVVELVYKSELALSKRYPLFPSSLGNPTLVPGNEHAIRHYQLHQNSPSNDCQGQGSLILQIISLNTLVDVIRVPKTCPSANLIFNSYSPYITSTSTSILFEGYYHTSGSSYVSDASPFLWTDKN